jgi:phage FluMu gp28-like protein
LIGKPTYLTVFRKEWQGQNHVMLFGAIKALVQTWRPVRVVIDATGVGEGLWGMLDNAFGSQQVLPVKFTASLKSELGYGLIGILESGRYREYHPFDEKLRQQLEHCRSEILPGPSKLMRWGVPDGARDRPSGQPVHDDDLITAALCHILDGLEWHVPTGGAVWTTPRDPLLDMDHHF